MVLHFVDGLDEVEKGFGAFGFVGDFFGGAICGFEDSVIFEVVKDVTVEIKFLSSVDIDPIEKRDKITEGSFLDFDSAEGLGNGL